MKKEQAKPGPVDQAPCIVCGAYEGDHDKGCAVDDDVRYWNLVKRLGVEEFIKKPRYAQ